MLQHLGVARNILSDRLRRLVDSGLLERRPIAPGSKRYEYVATDRARSLRDALKQLEAWGERECPARTEAAE
jgi:DNA-binding HxlR family transcriptional regulator